MPGRRSIAAMPPFAWRPPWLEQKMPSTPASIARLASCRLCPADQALRDFPIGGRIELKETWRIPKFGGHLLKGINAEGRSHHRYADPLRGHRRRNVTAQILRA